MQKQKRVFNDDNKKRDFNDDNKNLDVFIKMLNFVFRF